MLKLENLVEYDAAAMWCAAKGLRGTYGDRLPNLLSVNCFNAINEDIAAFEKRVRECAYALSMQGGAP